MVEKIKDILAKTENSFKEFQIGKTFTKKVVILTITDKMKVYVFNSSITTKHTDLLLKGDIIAIGKIMGLLE